MCVDFDEATTQIEYEAMNRLLPYNVGVVPITAAHHVTSTTTAPVMFTQSGDIVEPDMLLVGSGGQFAWCEVKGKTGPSWRREPPGPRWEVGIDYSLVIEYARLQDRTNVPVVMLFHESMSPVDPKSDNGKAASNTWMAITLKKVQQVGEHRPEWLGGDKRPWDRGRDGTGGWLWARNDMLIGDVVWGAIAGLVGVNLGGQ